MISPIILFHRCYRAAWRIMGNLSGSQSAGFGIFASPVDIDADSMARLARLAAHVRQRVRQEFRAAIRSAPGFARDFHIHLSAGGARMIPWVR
jgi:hypothetical protein